MGEVVDGLLKGGRLPARVNVVDGHRQLLAFRPESCLRTRVEEDLPKKVASKAPVGLRQHK